MTLPQALDRLRLIDDEMMRVALQDQIDLVQFILRIILRAPALRITRMETQKDIHQLGHGRSLVLDVWAVDSDGTQYNIEIQRASRGAAGSRARYHGAVMDTAALRANASTRELPKTRIIFITEEDCIGDGKLLHHFGMRDLNDGTPLDTGQEILYLNTAYDGPVGPGEQDLAALAHDFTCSDPEDMILAPLAEQMRYIKTTKEGRALVSGVVEQYARQVAAEAAKKAAEEAAEEAAKVATKAATKATEARIVSRMFAAGGFTPQMIADLTGLSLENVNEIGRAQHT